MKGMPYQIPSTVVHTAGQNGGPATSGAETTV